MTRDVPEELRVIAIHPISRAFGWVVLEGQQRLIDWGVKYGNTDRRASWLPGFAELLDYFDPHMAVFEDTTAPGSRRCRRIQELIAGAVRLAAVRRIRSRRIPRQKVKDVFVQLGATTKHQVAAVIAKRFPELDPRLPPLRKPWMSEDDRMSIFDAMAFAIATFDSELGRKQSNPPAK